jgi:hypothetical protein
MSARTREAALYGAAAVTYVTAGVFVTELALSWVVGFAWLLAWVCGLPAAIRWVRSLRPAAGEPEVAPE